MAVVYVRARRYNNGTSQAIHFVGSKSHDGFVYFNDETMYRCAFDGSNLQLFYFPKQIWTQTNNLTNLQISNFDVLQVISDAISGVESGGVNASNADVEKAVQWLVKKASNEYITYSQTNRNLKNPNGTSYDCSSFVITGFTVGGFNIDATYTGNMKAGFTAAGFQWIPGTTFESSQCKRGDILLNEALHTQVYIGNNQDVNCGNTPARVQQHSVNNYGSGWNGILRYS